MIQKKDYKIYCFEVLNGRGKKYCKKTRLYKKFEYGQKTQELALDFFCDFFCEKLNRKYPNYAQRDKIKQILVDKNLNIHQKVKKIHYETFYRRYEFNSKIVKEIEKSLCNFSIKAKEYFY